MNHSSVRSFAACLLLALDVSFAPSLSAGENVWTNGGPNDAINALAVDPKTPSTLYAVGYDKVFRSTDSGGTWSTTGIEVPAWDYGGSAIAIDPSTPSTLYVGGEYGVSKSTDSGASSVATGPKDGGVLALAIDPLRPPTLYAGTNGYGVLKSTDSGGSWSPLNAGVTNLWVFALVINPASPSILYAGTDGHGVFRSPDSGGTWYVVNDGLTNHRIKALAIDPSTPSTLYAGTYGGGVFKSTDSGGTWAAASGGLTSLRVPALAVDARTPSTLYAGTDGGGVFRSSDSGQSWEPLNAGLTDMHVTSLALDPAGANLYAATHSSKGVWRANVGPATTFLLPTSARLHGPNGAFYTTNLSLANTGAAPLSFTMRFLGHDQDGSSGPERTFDLEAGRSVTTFDVLGSVFGQGANYGAIRITSDQPTLSVVSVISTPGCGGTLGQTVPAFRESELIPAGSRRSILYVREGDGFRSNLVLASNAGVPTAVDVELVSPEGVALSARRYAVPPNGMTQIGRVARDMGVTGGVTGARLVVSSPTDGARFAALLFVIDEVTNSPTVIEAK